MENQVDNAVRDELTQLRNEISQMRNQLKDLRTVLIGEDSLNLGPQSQVEIEQTIRQGAEAYMRGLSTSPYGESTPLERWWRLGWTLAKSVSQAKAGWH